MARILSIDFGRKRTGIAVTDTLKIIASGLATVPTGELLSFLMHYFEQEDVELVVIGLPRQMNNVPSENMRYIEPFVVQFKKQFPQMPIVYFDERFTSSLAHRVMLDGGLKKKDRQNKALVDEISATIILQDYLESKQYKERL
ncbi:MULTISPECIES: Holliday junction resolvase RuvX [Bacteroidales]|uniref:Holliday junction resolvase RuvX n=1 Tax=Bacteroidales TaxID=171549 RepID=UPI0005752391|nr:MULTISPECIES: Holliday junction resolvase RuvX [Bacteroidales]KHM44814.1 Holliday junction resolvase [Coprobacter secundus]